MGTRTVRYGRIGSDGQSRTKEFASNADAEAPCQKLIQAKVGKGYKGGHQEGQRRTKLPPQRQAEFEAQTVVGSGYWQNDGGRTMTCSLSDGSLS